MEKQYEINEETIIEIEKDDDKIDGRKLAYDQSCTARKIIIKLIKLGKTKKEIASNTGLSLRRVQTLVKEYEETGKISKPKLHGRKIGEKKILSPEQERKIKRLIIDKYPDQYTFEFMLWTLHAVRELILQRFGLKLGKTTMVEYLHSWGMSCQRPTKQVTKQNHENTEIFKKEIYPSIKKRANEENAEIYFGNERRINNLDYNPMGHAPKNCPPLVKLITSREAVNMMSAVSPSGQLKFMLYEETTTQQKLIEFMTRLEKERQKDKIFLFLDNLKVHHGKLVKEWLLEHHDHIQVFYFPSYAPELNPQEYLNNILKQNIHSGIAPKCKK